MQEAREDPGRSGRKAYIQQKSVYRIQQKPRGRGARQRDPAGRLSRKGPNETMVEFRDVGTNREIALRGWPPRSSSAREEGDGTQDVLPRTTTTLVVLKTSGTMLW